MIPASFQSRRAALLAAALARHGEIVRIHNTDEDYTEQAGDLIFWYNDTAGSTHIIRESSLNN